MHPLPRGGQNLPETPGIRLSEAPLPMSLAPQPSPHSTWTLTLVSPSAGRLLVQPELLSDKQARLLPTPLPPTNAATAATISTGKKKEMK